ncbi:eukaryotic translation initiation factor 3 subunit M-like [Strongylocentrotus purpuratus]|uniref:Uncharacterized protein n=1 Tax=Strongylocentrotus purpuratus TaxID=7668 RepID=A0A7M7T0I9_STRPU|nr:eukaryotic translation initiation factor 3 subunit M-like [Strongylocentrotus purpuratus]
MWHRKINCVAYQELIDFFLFLFCSLNSLFHGVGKTNPLAYHVYTGMLRVAAKYENIDQVVTDLDKVKKWTIQWELNRDRINNVYRLLYEGLKESKHG